MSDTCRLPNCTRDIGMVDDDHVNYRSEAYYSPKQATIDSQSETRAPDVAGSDVAHAATRPRRA